MPLDILNMTVLLVYKIMTDQVYDHLAMAVAGAAQFDVNGELPWGGN